jgi:hypothetical protein
MSIAQIVKNSTINKIRRNTLEIKAWANRQYAPPSPSFIKHACLVRNSIPNGTWVETGTYLGDTTKVLAAHSRRVVSIEPEPQLYRNATIRLAYFRNIELIMGCSEDVFPHLLPTIRGDVNFWLDGHYSSGVTHRGRLLSPLEKELSCIQANLKHFGRLCVMIDDVRCLKGQGQEQEGYPSLDLLIGWAESNECSWHIEHDIFCARR